MNITKEEIEKLREALNKGESYADVYGANSAQEFSEYHDILTAIEQQPMQQEPVTRDLCEKCKHIHRTDITCEEVWASLPKRYYGNSTDTSVDRKCIPKLELPRTFTREDLAKEQRQQEIELDEWLEASRSQAKAHPILPVADERKSVSCAMADKAQVMGRVMHRETQGDVIAALNSEGRQLGDNAPLYASPMDFTPEEQKNIRRSFYEQGWKDAMSNFKPPKFVEAPEVPEDSAASYAHPITNIPEGWQLVPKIISGEMYDAAKGAIGVVNDKMHVCSPDMYYAFLRAAPAYTTKDGSNGK